MESISFLIEFKIYFANVQIMGAYAHTLGDFLFPPLPTFLSSLTVMTELSEFISGLGLSCVFPALQAIKAQLLLATLAPIVLNLCIATSFFFRVQVLRHHRDRVLQEHCACAFLLMYISLPAISATIFKSLSCDTTRLNESGERFLFADYSGAFSSICFCWLS